MSQSNFSKKITSVKLIFISVEAETTTVVPHDPEALAFCHTACQDGYQ